MGKNVYYKKWIRVPLLPGWESRSGPDVGCSPSCGSGATAKVLAAECCGVLEEHEWSLGCLLSLPGRWSSRVTLVVWGSIIEHLKIIKKLPPNYFGGVESRYLIIYLLEVLPMVLPCTGFLALVVWIFTVYWFALLARTRVNDFELLRTI